MSAPSSSPSPVQNASSARPFILLAILVVALGSLAYDRLVARPGAERGYQIVMNLAEQRSTSAHGADQIGPKQVQDKLGKKPVSVETKDRYQIETYNWRGGALVKSYFVKVVYTHGKPTNKPQENPQAATVDNSGEANLLLYTALLNEEPNEDNLPSNKLLSASEADPRPETGPTGIGPPGGVVRPPSGVTPPVPDDAKPDADKPDDAPKP